MGWASGTNEGREIHTGFWGENLREKNHVEDLSLEGDIIYLNVTNRNRMEGGTDCCNLTQNGTVVGSFLTVKNHRFS
jgi:N6-adenosine-specific RNA methylase IME4